MTVFTRYWKGTVFFNELNNEIVARQHSAGNQLYQRKVKNQNTLVDTLSFESSDQNTFAIQPVLV